MRVSSSLAVVFSICSVGAWAQEPLRDGLWEISVQGQVEGKSVSSTPLRTRLCINQQSAPDLLAQLTGAGAGCRLYDVQQDGNHVRWYLNCQGLVEVSGTGDITMTGDSFDGTLRLVAGKGDQGNPKLETFNARRLGACK